MADHVRMRPASWDFIARHRRVDNCRGEPTKAAEQDVHDWTKEACVDCHLDSSLAQLGEHGRRAGYFSNFWGRGVVVAHATREVGMKGVDVLYGRRYGIWLSELLE